MFIYYFLTFLEWSVKAYELCHAICIENIYSVQV